MTTSSATTPSASNGGSAPDSPPAPQVSDSATIVAGSSAIATDSDGQVTGLTTVVVDVSKSGVVLNKVSKVSN